MLQLRVQYPLPSMYWLPSCPYCFPDFRCSGKVRLYVRRRLRSPLFPGSPPPWFSSASSSSSSASAPAQRHRSVKQVASTTGEVIKKSSSVQVAKRNICLSNLLQRVPKMAPNPRRCYDSSSHSVGDTLSNQMKDKNKPPRRREDSGFLCLQWVFLTYPVV